MVLSEPGTLFKGSPGKCEDRLDVLDRCFVHMLSGRSARTVFGERPRSNGRIVSLRSPVREVADI